MNRIRLGSLWTLGFALAVLFSWANLARAQTMIVACPAAWGDSGGSTSKVCTGCSAPIWTAPDVTDRVKSDASRNSWPLLGSLQMTDTLAVGPPGKVEGSPADCSELVGAQTVAQVLGTLTSTTPAPPTTPTLTGSATITWGVPATNTDGSALTNLTGYRIEYGQGGAFGSSVSVMAGTTTYTFSLPAGDWQARVVALTGTSESAPTNPAPFTVVATSPTPAPTPTPTPAPSPAWVVAPTSSNSRPVYEAVLNAAGTTLVRGNTEGQIASGKPCGDEIFKISTNSYRSVAESDASLASPTYKGRKHVAICTSQ